jgi:Kdo2-lipid IVA lauroyltransferase/acyltransferase
VKSAAQENIIKKTKHQVMYACVLALVTVLRFLPRRTALAVMRGMGWAAFYLMKSARHRTLRHLSMAFGHEKPSSEIHRIAKQVFSNLGAFAADAVRIPRVSQNDVHELISAEGFEHLDALSRNKESAILLTAHFGNWELLGAWGAKRGYKVKVIGAPQSNQWLDRMLVDARDAAGYQSITRGGNTREIVRALAEGYSIGVLIDEDTKVDGVFVKFFNQWAHTPAGPVRLARKYGLKIIPAFIYLRSDDTYHVQVMDPLPLVFTGDKRRDLIVNTQMCSDACEGIIRKHPEQWLWMMRRWKNQPKGERLEACERDFKAAYASLEQ